MKEEIKYRKRMIFTRILALNFVIGPIVIALNPDAFPYAFRLTIADLLISIYWLIAIGILIVDILLVVMIKQQKELIQTLKTQGKIETLKTQGSIKTEQSESGYLEMLDASDINGKTCDQIHEKLSSLHEEQTGEPYLGDAEAKKKLKQDLLKLGYSPLEVWRDGDRVIIYRTS